MEMVKEDKDLGKELYTKLTKEADKLETEYGKKANVLQRAYEAAVSELGYADRELVDETKAKKVAMLMFSDKYLGDAKFNPLLNAPLYSGFGKKGDVEKQRDFEHMLGMNLNSFVGKGGIIDHHDGLKRVSMASAVERQYQAQMMQQLTSLSWQKLYDPKKSLGDRVASYMGVLHQDPILSGTGAKTDPTKFDSVDDVARALTMSTMGSMNRDTLQHKYGAQFN
jgi:hypothetical protein